MKSFKILIISIFLIFLVTSCAGVQDSFTKNKRQGDEFLVKKKNPLVLPPDFEDLPVPKKDQENQVVEEEDFKIKEKLGKAIETEPNSSQNNSLEKSILEKINES